MSVAALPRALDAFDRHVQDVRSWVRHPSTVRIVVGTTSGSIYVLDGCEFGLDIRQLEGTSIAEHLGSEGRGMFTYTVTSLDTSPAVGGQMLFKVLDRVGNPWLLRTSVITDVSVVCTPDPVQPVTYSTCWTCGYERPSGTPCGLPCV